MIIKRRAVILFSGGLDSATTLALAHFEGFELYILTFLYGQRHNIESEAANSIAKHYPVAEHKLINIDLSTFGGSSLTSSLKVPKGQSIRDDIPNTYVPARNTIFLSYALAFAEVIQSRDIFIGANAVDYSNYPDCRPQYLQAFETMANFATKQGVQGNPTRIHAPLLNLKKSEIIKRGIELGVDYGATHSCYDPIEDYACGKCDSCMLRKKGFNEAKLKDPTKYHPSITHKNNGVRYEWH